MSGYSGGVAITQLSSFNSNPRTMKRIRAEQEGARTLVSGTTYDTSFTNATNFFERLARYNGAEPAVSAAIGAGFDLINTTGAGFMGAIMLPIPAATAGNFTLTITIDGVATVFSAPCSAAHRNILLPNSRQGEDAAGVQGQAASDGAGWMLHQGNTSATGLTIKGIGDYIADKTAIRFEQSLRVRISTGTAISTGGVTNKALVQCLKD